MTSPERTEIMIKLDAIDTALEAPDADKAAILREADAWFSAHPMGDVDDATYFKEHLQGIRERHGA